MIYEITMMQRTKERLMNMNVKACVLLAVGLLLVSAGSAQAQKLALPSPEQLVWQEMEIGMMIHFGMETYRDKETDDKPTLENLKLFNPTKLDTDQWVRVAESMGAKYIVFVAKHPSFCLWQTDTTEYSIKNSPWKNGKGDVVAELAASCRKRGMRLGIYVYPGNFYHGAGVGGKTSDPEKQAEYTKMYRQQLTELLANYGTMFEIWYDGSCIIPAGDIITEHAPHAIIFQGQYKYIGDKYTSIRWVGNERGYAPDPAWNSVKGEAAKTGTITARHGTPEGDVWVPNECDTTIRHHHWFWNTYSEKDLKSLDTLMDTYYRSVGHGSVLLLNVAPDRSGLMPQADAKRAAEFGAEIKRRFGRSIMETYGQGREIKLDRGGDTAIDHVITQEVIACGERVREYVVEGLVGGAWKELARGTAIGHKKIDRFEPVNISKIRLRVTKSAAEPMIRKFAVYNVSGT